MILTTQSHSVKAICIKDTDPRSEVKCEELLIGKVYTPDYLVIGRSWSYLCIKESPGKEYNAVMFDYQEEDGRSINLRKDIICPIMERYGEYLYDEFAHTGTWVVYVKLNDTTKSPIPEIDKYRIVLYGSFELENDRRTIQQ